MDNLGFTAKTCGPKGDLNDKFIIGIYSKCETKAKQQRLAMPKIMSMKMNSTIAKLTGQYTCLEIDVCEDETLLVKVIDSLILDPRFLTTKNENELKVKAIFTFIPETMLKTAVALLSFTDVQIFPLFTVAVQNQDWFERSKNFFPIVEFIEEDIVVNLINRFDWKHVAIFDLVADNMVDSKEELFKLDRVQKELPGHCFDYDVIKLSSLFQQKQNLSTFKTLRNDKTIKTVIVRGQLSALFMNNAVGVNVNWILFSQTRGQNKVDTEFISIFENVVNDKNQASLNYQKIVYQNDTICNPHFQRILSTENKARTCSTAPVGSDKTNIYNYNKMHFEYASHLVSKQIEVFNNLEEAHDFKNKIILYQHTSGEKKGKDFNFVKDLPLTKKISHLGPGSCRECKMCKLQCQSTQVRIVEPYAKLTRTIALGCLQCKAKTSILNRTYGTCSKCPEKTISNHNQSICYNHIIHEEIFMSCYIVNTIGLCICLFIGIVYYKNRETPVVRSSDFRVSIMQLVLCSLLFIALPFLSFSHLTGLICTLRPCILGPLLVSIVAIVVCKAEKILIIFYTRRKLSQSDITDIYIRQAVILGFLLVIDMIILPTTFSLPSTVKLRNHGIRKGDQFFMEYCSNDDRFDFQIVYCIVLLLLAILQGYRGRKLPRNYNEGNSIIVSAATAACAFTFKIWVTTTDQHKYERTSTAWLSLSVSVLFIILPLYGPKVYIILFLPHKNTKKHLMNRMLYESAMKRSMVSTEDSFSVALEKESLKSLLVKTEQNGARPDSKKRNNCENIEMSFIE